eukprot:scaffold175957_cov60-Attheya_sp.AAC.4
MGVIWRVLQFMSDMLQHWNEKSTITQEVWVQQMLQNVIDSVGSTSASLILHFQFVITMLVMRYHPNEAHINTSLVELSDEQWYSSFVKQLIGLIGTVVVLVVVGFVYEKYTFNSNPKEAEPFHITMTGVLKHIYSDKNIKFLFLWFLATGIFVWSIMFTHFGVDFTLKFEWLSCTLGNSARWSGQVVMSQFKMLICGSHNEENYLFSMGLGESCAIDTSSSVNTFSTLISLEGLQQFLSIYLSKDMTRGQTIK